MASGWTGGLIAPDMRVHDAAHAAIDSTGGSVTHALRTAAAAPQARIASGVAPGEYYSNTPSMNTFQAGLTTPAPTPTSIATQMLQDPILGSRVMPGTNPPTRTPVGSASVYQNGNIPSTVASAVANLNTNTQSNSLAGILQQILHGVGSSYTPSPQQNALYDAQTAQLNQQAATQSLPGQIQSKIDTLQAANPPRYGFSPPALPGQYNPAADAALQNLYGQQAAAKQAARGWTAPTY